MKGESKYKHNTTTRRLASNKKKAAKKKKKFFRIIFWVLRPTFMPHAAALSLNILSWSASWPAMLLEIEIFVGRCYQFFFRWSGMNLCVEGKLSEFLKLYNSFTREWKLMKNWLTLFFDASLSLLLLSRGELIFSSLRKQPLSSGW